MEIAVIGLGRFGSSVATTLASRGVNVTVFDIDAERIKKIIDFVDGGYVIDSTDEKALAEASIEHFDKVIIALGKTALNDSLLTALNLKELGVAKIVAKASSDAHKKILDKIGVDLVVQPERDMGIRIATKMSSFCLVDYVEISSDTSIESIVVNHYMRKIVGKSIQEINLRKKFNVNIISIERHGNIIIPESDTVIFENDILMIIGKILNLREFEKYFKIK